MLREAVEESAPATDDGGRAMEASCPAEAERAAIPERRHLLLSFVPGAAYEQLEALKAAMPERPQLLRSLVPGAVYQQLDALGSGSYFARGVEEWGRWGWGQRAAAASAAVLLLGALLAFACLAPGMSGHGGGVHAGSATPNGGGALTSLSEDHPAGATQIQVESSHGFEIGDVITISHPANGGYSEEREIVDMGSIILNKPLEHEYPAGSKVKKVLPAKEETVKSAKASHEETPPVQVTTWEPAEDPILAPAPISPSPQPTSESTEDPTLGPTPISPTSEPAENPTAVPAPMPTPAEAEEEAFQAGPENSGPTVISFYLYRASGDTNYPLENVNVGNLAGVLWYLHNEIVVSPMRKYNIDRIKRFKIRMKPVVEFWNVHHANFGPFMAYDAARCSTPSCKDVYDLYGYIVGCQSVTPGRCAYEAMWDTLSEKACAQAGISCRSPTWYSLPGPCPLKKISAATVKEQTNDHGIENPLDASLVASSAEEAKSDACRAAEPGGRCEGEPTGAPDCVYSVEDAGEVMLDGLVGTLPSFAEWFKGPSVTREYDENTDRGIGVTFWDGRNDPGKCMDRLKQVLAKFEQMHGVDPDLTAGQPICDFDGWYSGEFDGVWPRNHTGAVEPSRGFAWADGWAGEGGEEYGSELASEEDEEEEPAATAIEPASEEQGDYYAYVGADSGIAS